MNQYFPRPAHADYQQAAQILQKHAVPFREPGDVEYLVSSIRNARVVMLGEASHGTHEFYAWRAEISKYLIEKEGFQFVAVEGDWPDCYQLNRFAKGYDSDHKGAIPVMREFSRWPEWMWANEETAAFIEWLRQFNATRPAGKKAGFYGLDVYSLWQSMDLILDYLETRDPAAYETAKAAYSCFEPFRKDDGMGYARVMQLVPERCEAEVVNLLKTIQKRLAQYNHDPENVFSTEQNALVAVNAEKYYHAMVQGGPHSWNVRDRHMAETLDRLLRFHGKNAKAIVWAHNTHVGDARATDMIREGMFNIGELARVKYGEPNVALVGFGTYEGQVMAGRHWGATPEIMDLPPAMRGSLESIFHELGGNRMVLTSHLVPYDVFLENHLFHRAVGVVYQAKYEKYGNYVPTIVPLRYDAFIHIDQTTALHALAVNHPAAGSPESLPFGI